jgi:hypothetical protein
MKARRGISPGRGKKSGEGNVSTPRDRIQKNREKEHPAVRTEYKYLDVELDLTIQLETSNDGIKSENPGFRGKH